MRRFRPTLLGSIAAAAGAAIALSLGFWQVDRAEQKLALIAEQERLANAPALRLGRESLPSTPIELRPVEARGRFEPDALVFIDNRIRHGVIGFEIVMPLRITADQSYVLVNRGWIAGTGDRRRLPEVRTPSEEIHVSGIATVPGKRIYELGTQTAEGRVWQNLSIERYRTHSQIAILPFVIQQHNDIGDGLVREWPALDRGVNTHRSYALQWFALAALIVVLFIVLSVHRDASNA